MKIAFVSSFFSEGMGYTENMLPKALASLGHEVHVVASCLQVYGNQTDYAESYQTFLGPPACRSGVSTVDGFVLHRLPHYTLGGYVGLRGLSKTLARLEPDIVQFGGAATLTLLMTLLPPVRIRWPVFTENHQHLSVGWAPRGRGFPLNHIHRLWYALTRSWPVGLAHRRVEKCFAISEDCKTTAYRLYRIPTHKIVSLPLGTDTDLFRPCSSESEILEREKMRAEWNVGAQDVLCVYTGRFTASKNPLLLARSIHMLRCSAQKFHGLFVGDGPQGDEIRALPGCKVIAFRKHVDLASIYRAADLAVWPSQESMSMLDAAACGLPLIVGEKMGEPSRIDGNGRTFCDGDAESLARALVALRPSAIRHRMGRVGREKMVSKCSWEKHAEVRLRHYEMALLSNRKRNRSVALM